MIRLTPQHLEAIRDHGRRSYPEECCGALIGSAEGERTVVRVEAADNVKDDERQRRYLIHPDDVRRLDERARAEDLDIIGFYHSHPDHPARPSDFDREHAWPWYSYIIVPVADGVPGAPRSWRLREDRTTFDEEEIATISPMPKTRIE